MSTDQPTPPPSPYTSGDVPAASPPPYTAPAPPPAAAAPPPAYGARPTNSMALVSLIFGILGLTLLFFIGSIVAVVTASQADSQIARTGEEGAGMARAGRILGWIGIALGVASIVIGIIVFIFVLGAATVSSG